MIIKTILFLLALYLLFVFFSAYLLFLLPFSYKQQSSSVESMYSNERKNNQDQVFLLEDGFESGKVKMQAIREATSSIDFVSYSVQKGGTSHLFFAELFDAADRGVHVRILLDGLFHNLRGDLSDVKDAIAAHPNMELRYYEPFKAFKPWTWHNRLHDKLLIIDETYGIIGGRNVGDKYLASPPPKGYVLDRDVLIYNVDYEPDSSVVEMKSYANELWDHPFTKIKNKRRSHSTGIAFQRSLAEKLQKAKHNRDPLALPLNPDWRSRAIQTEYVSFMHNPLTRLNKDPVLWRAFTTLVENAQSKVYVQTPYAIPTKHMTEYVQTPLNPDVTWTMLTNSIKQTPNPLAFSGYLSVRPDIIDSGFSVYEYQGPHSIHAKSFVIDDELSMVGSFNLDGRSSYLNTESAVLIQGSAFAKELTTKMDEKARKSQILTKEKPSAEEQKSLKTIAIHALSSLSFLWRVFL